MGNEQNGEPSATGVTVDAVKANVEQLSSACAQIAAQRESRAANLDPKRPGEIDLARLDSSIKKNGAFIKKLRQLGSDNRQQLLTEASKLNLSKYVSEAVSALADIPLKTADIPAALEMAAALHARYPDFAASYGQAVAKVASGPGKSSDEDRMAARRQRGALRLLPELLAAGIVTDPSGFLSVIKSLVSGMDFSNDRESALHNATLLGGVIKPAAVLLLGAQPETVAAASLPSELMGTQDTSSLPAELGQAVTRLQDVQKQLQEELDQRYQLGADHKQLLVRMFERAFDSCSSTLVDSHKALVALDKDNAKAFATKGELPEGAAAEYESSRKAYEALHRATTTMAEALGKSLPELAEDAFTRIEEGVPAAASAASAGGADAVEHVFEDPEARAFYEQLPDLWSLVPTILLKDATKPRSDASSNAATASAEEITAPETATTAEIAGTDARDKVDGSAAAAAADSTAPSESISVGSSSAAAVSADSTIASATDGTAPAVPEQPSGVDAILARLPSCVSRDLCDELAVNFCYSNSKGARKKLVRALVDVPRGSLQLLPYYARVAATISQAYPEVGAGVVAAVEADFDALAAKKDLTRAGEEPRLRVARYLAELAKFRLAPPSSVLLRLKVLLDDFTGTAMDGAAALVENAGRFLLRLPESKVRMENLLSVMMRLRNARHLDSRQSNAIDTAYFACRPPDKNTQRRRRPPLQEYIRHLVFERLSDGSIVEVLKKLMKLPWAETEPYLLKCLMKVVRVRYQHIALIASLAGGLAQYHDSLGVGLVDLVLEDVRWGLEHPSAGNYQQRMAQVRLLGEAYNYMLLDSRAIFDVLYLLIGFGHDNEEVAMKLDPPDDYFRIRLVVALLLTCGSYFNKGSAKRRLDRFLTFMQAYVLAKHPLPLDIDADLQDMYDQLRPSLHRFSSYAEAAAAVSDILAKEAAASASGLEPIDEEDSDAESDTQEQDRAKADDVEDVMDVDDNADDDDEMADYIREEEQAVDDEFEREYKTLMQECQGRTVAPPAAAVAAATPTDAASAPAAQTSSVNESSSSSSSSSSSTHVAAQHAQQHRHQVHRHRRDHDGDDDEPSVAFKVLMKRSGKDERKEIQIPADEAIAVRLMAKQESEAAERSQIKALVLEANQREEAEEAAAAAAARAAAAAGRRGYRGGRGRSQGHYRYQTPGRGQQGPQLTLRGHVHQLTGEREEKYPG